VGANLAAAALVGGLMSGVGSRGLSGLWELGVTAGVTALVVGFAFRFPRSAGLPFVLLGALAAGGVWRALESFSPWDAQREPYRVQPLTDREVVTAFAVRADVLEVPVRLPLPETWVRVRPGDDSPPEWWWPVVSSWGWAHSRSAATPDRPLKFGVYRLDGEDSQPAWRLEKPELLPDS